MPADEAKRRATTFATLGYDAGALVAAGIRDGAESRLALRARLAKRAWTYGESGTFRFDGLGNRIDRPPSVTGGRKSGVPGLSGTAATDRIPKRTGGG